MERMASIEMALMNEETEMKFYQNEAQRSNNPLAKTMFEVLARDEQEHMERIRGLHGKLQAEGAWPGEVPIEVAGTDIRESLENLVGKVGSAEDHDDDDVAAIKKAIDFETKGEQFYKDLAASTDNAAEKTFFDFLAGIEREHRLSLIDTLNYLDDPEGWMSQHERVTLDGA